MRRRTAPHGPSHLWVMLLSLLFLVSAQLCYATAHVIPAGSHITQSSAPNAHVHHADKSAPAQHGKQPGVKSTFACVMMTCGGIVQPVVSLGTITPSQDFGLPPHVAAMNGSELYDFLRPPIEFQL